MKIEMIENKWERKSCRKNSKWRLTWTNAKEIDDCRLMKMLDDFSRCPYEKYVEDYQGIQKDGKKYVIINGLIKKEIIILYY